MRQVPLPTTPDIYENVYHYFHYRRHVNDYFPRRPVNDYFHYRRENDYFLRRTRTAPKCTLQRYNAEMTDRDRMHVLYEMYHMFAPCPICPSFAMPPSRGNPEVGSTPPSLACCAHPHTSLLHRYLNRVIGTDMLPWHHFRICCRGTIFVIVAVAPLLFRHGDQMLPIMLMSKIGRAHV